MLLSGIIIYIISKNVHHETFIKTIVLIAGFNGIIIGLQVLEQTLTMNFLPIFLKYGGIWGFSENNDYEIFKKGGLLPSTQTSSILCLLSCLYIIYYKKLYILLIPNILGVFFGARTTLVLFFAMLIIIISSNLFKFLLSNKKALNYSLNKYFFQNLVYFLLTIWLIILWFNTDLGSHQLLRIQQVVSVISELNFADDVSGGGAFQYFRLPSNDMHALIGNGLSRFHELGGNDPLYPRWFLQSGAISLFLILLIFLICFIVEYKFTQSRGLITILLLIQGFKGEVLTSLLFFDIYLLYLFSCKKMTDKTLQYH